MKYCYIVGDLYMEYVFTIMVSVIAVVMIVVVSKKIASHAIVCRNCSKQFYISWKRMLVNKHIDNKYLLVCPHCKMKDWYIEKAD